MPSADLLRAFVAVAELGSVSRAADGLDLGKSVVSKRVAQLEALLGTVLFARSTRRVALTPGGEAYLDHARRALAELAAGEERLRALRSDLSGRIRLTATVSWGQRVLAQALPEFLRLHPGVEVDLQLSDRMMDLAFERIDVALRWASATPPGLVADAVARVGWALVATPAYLAVHGAPVTPLALATHAGLCYWRDTGDDVWLLGRQPAPQADDVRVQVRGRYHVDNPEAVAEAALAGLGVALLPDYLCRDALADGRLTRVLPDWTPHTRFGTHVIALAAPERARLPRNRALLAFLRERFAP